MHSIARLLRSVRKAGSLPVCVLLLQSTPPAHLIANLPRSFHSHAGYVRWRDADSKLGALLAPGSDRQEVHYCDRI